MTTLRMRAAPPILVALALVSMDSSLQASEPLPLPIFDVFDDVNPCTGAMHTVTVTGTARLHDHDGRLVVHVERVVSTSTGFEGRGAQAFIDNGQIIRLALNDVLVHPDGSRIRAHANLLIDVATSEVRVARGRVVCVGG